MLYEKDERAARAARAEEDLRESEARFRALVNQALVAVAELSLEGNYTLVNARFCQMSGYGEAELLTMNVRGLVYPDDLPRSLEEFTQVVTSGTPALAEKRLVRKDGSLVWISDGMSIIHDRNDQKHCVAMIAMDITDRKHIEEALEMRVRERTSTLMERTAELAEMSQMRQELLRQLVTAQEEERANISRDLHDDTGQQLTAMLLGLESLKNAPGLAADTHAQETLVQVQALAEDVAKKAHRLSFTLRPTALDDLGLLGALQNYAEEWSCWSSMPVDLQTLGMADVSGSAVRLLPEVETTIYRIVQEALTNVLRHASLTTSGKAFATQVNLLIHRQAREVVATIEDDGPGFDVEAVLNLPPGQRRLGLFGMQERARLAGGTLAIESEMGEGTTIFLRLPLPLIDVAAFAASAAASSSSTPAPLSDG